MTFGAILLSGLITAASPVNAAPPQEPEITVGERDGTAALDQRYRECIALVEEAPEQGREEALRWVTDGGGPPAIHCAATADLANGLPRVAARRLYSLAEETEDAGYASRLYAQAAQAWLAGNEPESAITTLEKAYALRPGSVELHLIAAPVYAGAERWGDTKRVLDQAEKAMPLTPQALYLRAKAKQQLSDLDGAVRDIEEALRQRPDYVEALVLRGELIQAGYQVRLPRN